MGKCAACGICCQYIVLHPSWFKYDMDFLEVRNGILVGNKAFFYAPCKELAEDGKCRIYDHRPKFCGPGNETNYDELRVLGCRYTDQDDPGVIKIHVSDTFGMMEQIR
jgi:hypothetical protein